MIQLEIQLEISFTIDHFTLQASTLLSLEDLGLPSLPQRRWEACKELRSQALNAHEAHDAHDALVL